MSILASWCHVVHSSDVNPHKFDGLAMSGLAISDVADGQCRHSPHTTQATMNLRTLCVYVRLPLK